MQHAGIAAQLAVLLGLLYALEIEPDSGLPRILPLVVAGFIAHASLPPSQAPSWVPGTVLAVVGSMFMFRMIIYMYDLRHEELARRAGRNIPGGDASVWTRLSYFFLLPNVCFLHLQVDVHAGHTHK